MILLADVETNWATVALTALGILSFILKWVRDEQIAKNNATDRTKITTAQTVELKAAVKAEVAPVKETLAVVEEQTNGKMDAKFQAVAQRIDDVHTEVKKVADKQ